MHALKIDRSFTRTMVSDTHSRTIVDTVISLAHSLGVKVTAEGVETETSEAAGASICDELQGYLYSRPLIAADLTHFLETLPR